MTIQLPEWLFILFMGLTFGLILIYEILNYHNTCLKKEIARLDCTREEIRKAISELENERLQFLIESAPIELKAVPPFEERKD